MAKLEEQKLSYCQDCISSKNVGVIFVRELKNYFNTPIGYVSLIIFSLVINFMVFYLGRFWDMGKATLDSLFSFIRIVFIFFVPAITMRAWAEEKRAGTVELLFTLPISIVETILGKYLSSIAFLCVGLLTTIFIPILLGILASPDWSLIIGGYLGSVFLGSAYIALGLYISWLTHDQIVAFLSTLVACFVFFMLGYQPLLQLLGNFAPVFAFLSVSWHFDSLSRGLFDTRDIIYFITFVILFLYLNYRSIEKRQ